MKLIIVILKAVYQILCFISFPFNFVLIWQMHVLFFFLVRTQSLKENLLSFTTIYSKR